MKIVTYDDRISKMKKPSDVQKQLRLAKQYVMRLRSKSKNAKSLQMKIELQKAIKDAEAVLRRLRKNIFTLEDLI